MRDQPITRRRARLHPALLLLAAVPALPAAELVLSGTETGTVSHTHADQIATEAYTVASGAVVSIESPTAIVLRPGTVVQTGASLALRITENFSPTADAQSLGTDEDVPLAITLTGTDPEGATLSYEIVAQPANGSLAGTPPAVTYTPAANWNGSDAFTFLVSDGVNDSAAATVDISVAAIVDPPVVTGESYAMDVDDSQIATTAADGVLANDSDPLGGTLTAAVADTVDHGTLTLNADGSFTYVPTAGYRGADGFTYTVTNADATSAPILVGLSVADRPSAQESPMVASGDFDWQRYQEDEGYRSAYLSSAVPGRIWEIGVNSGVQLAISGERYVTVQVGSNVIIEALTQPGAPVTFSSVSGLSLGEGGRSVVTVGDENADGAVSATVDCRSSGRHVILVASPRAVGLVRIIIQVWE